MESLKVECLRCGTTRQQAPISLAGHTELECPRCGYLGWAPVQALTENDRRAFRRRPPERRRLRIA